MASGPFWPLYTPNIILLPGLDFESPVAPPGLHSYGRLLFEEDPGDLGPEGYLQAGRNLSVINEGQGYIGTMQTVISYSKPAVYKSACYQRPLFGGILSFHISFLFCFFPLPPLRGQPTVKCHPRWQPISGLAVHCRLGRLLDSNPGLQFYNLVSLPMSQHCSLVFIFLV